MKIQPLCDANVVSMWIIILSLIVFTWCYIGPTPVQPSASLQAKPTHLQSRGADGTQEAAVEAMQERRGSRVNRSYGSLTPDAVPRAVAPGGMTPAKGIKKPESFSSRSFSPSNTDDESFPVDNSNNIPGGTIAAGDVALLMARAVEAEIDEPFSADPKEAAVLAAQYNRSEGNDDTEDLAVIELLGRALGEKFNAEDKADFLALASDISERTGISISPLVKYALRPGQPLSLQRQALYLATSCNIDIVSSVAMQANHPLKYDAQSFLLEHELAQGRRPATIDDLEGPDQIE